MGIKVTGGVKVPQGKFSVSITVPPVLNNLFSWGINSQGELGKNNTSTYNSPVQITGSNTWRVVGSGSYSHSAAIKNDGTLWMWGDNGNGQLGLDNVTDRSSPSQVGASTNWDKIALGGRFTLAIKTDGTLWSWGENNSFGNGGQLGLGDNNSRSSPVQIGTLTTWDKIAAGYAHSLAIKTDGKLWTWGRNYITGIPAARGALGDGTTTNRNSPVQIGSLNTWATVTGSHNHSHATRTDGTLWSWGDGRNGRLGTGNTTSRSSPHQVTGTIWASAAAGYSHAFALRTDGTLWAFGVGQGGKLGLGNTTNYNSPVQIPGTTWDKVYSGGNHTAALRTDGSLWTWGYGDNGKLGRGNTTNYSSPVQVGNATDWTSIAIHNNHTFGLREV